MLLIRPKTLLNYEGTVLYALHFSTGIGTSCKVLSSPCHPDKFALNSTTYTKLVQTAAKSGSAVLGRLAHGHMIKTSFNPCLFLLNNLLNMYCKCGELGFARHLFDGMSQRNIISFNSLISGYTQMGFHGRVMGLIAGARESGLKLDKFTYAGALSVCGERCDLEMGKMVHASVVVNGLAEQVFVINVLIDMYCKCGMLDQARYLFKNSNELDQVSWNSLISGCVRIGAAKETLSLLAEMHRDGLKLTTYTLGSALKACCINSNDRSIEQGMMIHGYVTKLGMELDIVVATALLDMYAKNEGLKEPIKIFDLMPEKNVVMYNAMISGFLQMDDITDECASKAFELFMEMQTKGLKPSASTLSTMLKACSAVKALEYGKQIHALICKNSFRSDEFIGSALIELYALLGSTEDGMKCFDSIPKQDIASWTSMIACHVQNEQFESAFDLFCQLFSSGIRPEEFVVSLMLSACADFAASGSGEQIQGYAIKSGIGNFTSVKTSNICMYAKSGDMQSADKIFNEVEYPDVAAYSAMICSHAQHGLANNALDLFESMRNYRIKPNHATFLGVLTACSHGGLVAEGLRYFESMRKDYGINPNEKHFSCLIDLLGRAGKLSEAESLILNSGFENHPVMWRALLSSCRVYKDRVTAKRIAERLIDLEPAASGSYVLLYNIYNEAGIQSPAMEVRELMRDRGVRKEPGLSWIEVRDGIHSFVVGDRSHPMSQMIYTRLQELLENTNKMGSEDETLVYAVL